MQSNEVKTPSPHHRLLIAFHSPCGVFETGPPNAHRRNWRQNRSTTATMTLSLVQFQSKNCEIAPISRNFQRNPGEVLCASDCMAAEEVWRNFSPSNSLLAGNLTGNFVNFRSKFARSFPVQTSFHGACSLNGAKYNREFYLRNRELFARLSRRTGNYLICRNVRDIGRWRSSGNPRCWRCSTQLGGSLPVSF
jgi:hypothetical protein